MIAGESTYTDSGLLTMAHSMVASRATHATARMIRVVLEDVLHAVKRLEEVEPEYAHMKHENRPAAEIAKRWGLR